MLLRNYMYVCADTEFFKGGVNCVLRGWGMEVGVLRHIFRKLYHEFNIIISGLEASISGHATSLVLLLCSR